MFFLWELLYPKRCGICDGILKSGEQGVCQTCEKNLPRISEPRCKRCSKPITSMGVEYCFDCSRREYLVKEGFGPYLYDDSMKLVMKHYKYDGDQELGKAFGKKLAKESKDWIQKRMPDVILPVPVHEKRLRFRGFNQAEILASELSLELRIPMDADYLTRTVNTAPQKTLDVGERIKNLKKSFTCGLNRRYDTVLLVDDIYTTGATLEACAHALMKHGTKQVIFVCLCIGAGEG